VVFSYLICRLRRSVVRDHDQLTTVTISPGECPKIIIEKHDSESASDFDREFQW
jgi:hypothetical protein